MDENRLEKHMRDKLSRYESLSDADAMWNAIQAKQNALEEKPKRRFPFYLVILVTAGIIIGGTMYIQFYDSSSDIAQNENASKSPNTKTETIISENIIQESKNQIIENSSISEEFNETLKGSDKSSQITSAKKLSNETITNKSKIEELVRTNNMAENTTLDQLPTSLNAKQIAGDQLKSKLAITSEEKEEIVASSFYPLSNMNKNLKSEESAIDGDNLEILSTNEQLNPNDEAITDVLLTSASRSIMQVNQIDPIRLSAFYNSDPNFNLDIPAIIFIKKRLKTTSENLWKWSIGAQIAYQYSIRSIDQLDGNPSAHLMNRKASEKSLDAYRLDLNAHLNYKNLYLESGISFSQITDKLSTTTIEEKTIFIDTITQVLIYKDSSTSYVQGMLEGVERIQTKHERYNRYSTIDIPIIFGYEQKFSAINWGFYLSGGILVNINFRKSGYILSPYDESLISLNELDSKGYWNDRLGMKLLVAGGIKYQWSPNLDFRFGPQFEFGGKSLTGQDSEIRQNYILMGLRAGVFFNF